MLAMTDGVVGWGSLRIDNGNGQLISGLCQVMIGEGEYRNARDDSAG